MRSYEQSQWISFVLFQLESIIILRANITEVQHPEKVYKQIIDVIIRLAEHGLIHGDLNEFNIMVDENEIVTIIDFPQMVSTSHLNAQMYILYFQVEN